MMTEELVAELHDQVAVKQARIEVLELKLQKPYRHSFSDEFPEETNGLYLELQKQRETLNQKNGRIVALEKSLYFQEQRLLELEGDQQRMSHDSGGDSHELEQWKQWAQRMPRMEGGRTEESDDLSSPRSTRRPSRSSSSHQPPHHCDHRHHHDEEEDRCDDVLLESAPPPVTAAVSITTSPSEEGVDLRESPTSPASLESRDPPGAETLVDVSFTPEPAIEDDISDEDVQSAVLPVSSQSSNPVVQSAQPTSTLPEEWEESREDVQHHEEMSWTPVTATTPGVARSSSRFPWEVSASHNPAQVFSNLTRDVRVAAYGGTSGSSSSQDAPPVLSGNDEWDDVVDHFLASSGAECM